MTAKGLGTAACIIIGLLIAWGASRGIPRSGPPPAWAGPAATATPTPAPSATPGGSPAPGTGGGGFDWPLLATFGVLVVIGVTGVHRYYLYKHRRLTLEIAQVNGWAEVRVPGMRDVRKCPGCRGWFELTDIDHHQERSSCAAYERWLEANPGKDGQSIRAHSTPWVVHESTTIPADQSINAGGYDSITEDNPAEIAN